MKKVVLLFALLFALAASAFAATTYASPQGGFTAEFLGTPKVEPLNGKSDGGVTYVGEMAYFENDTIFESFSYADYPQDITEEQTINAIKNVLQDEQAVPLNGGKVVLNGQTWFLVVAAVDKHVVYLGATSIKNRFYMLTVIDDNRDQDHVPDNFLNSIKFGPGTTEN